MVVQDVGRAVNPLTLRGQVIGSLVQGLGGAVLEDLKYDENGQFLTGSLADYLLPTATDFPNLRCVVLDDYPSPINPLGAKGAGEGGIIAAGGCMANAVANALQMLRRRAAAIAAVAGLYLGAGAGRPEAGRGVANRVSRARKRDPGPSSLGVNLGPGSALALALDAGHEAASLTPMRTSLDSPNTSRRQELP